MFLRSVALRTGLVTMLVCLAGCPGAEFLWQVRTQSTTRPPSFNPVVFEQQPVAVLEALTAAGLHGNEVGLSLALSRTLKRIEPTWKLVSPKETATRINQAGLAAEYVRMRIDYERSDILDREPLRKIGAALGARYVFQPRLAAFNQTIYRRWEFPGLNVRVLQTRVSILRQSLQLWDTETGELLWASLGEGTFQEEGLFHAPVYLREAGLIIWGSIVSDLTYERTAFRYTPMDALLDALSSPENVVKELPGNKPAAAPAGQ